MERICKLKFQQEQNSGDTITISSRGVPSSRGVGRGDVVVLCKLHMPKKFDKATKKSLEQLRENLNGKGDIVDRVIDDAESRRQLIIPLNLEFCKSYSLAWQP